MTSATKARFDHDYLRSGNVPPESTPKARPSGSSIAEIINSLAPTKNTDMESMDNNGPLLPARAIVLEWGMPFLV